MNRKPEGCKGCALQTRGHGYCDHSPLVKKPKLLIQGEAPGKNEMLSGQPFVGKAGDCLWGLLRSVGLNKEDVIVDNTIRCLMGGVSGKYPTGKAKLEAEKQCRQYDIWDKYLGVPLMCVGGKSAGQKLGVDKITDWHGHIEVKGGRLVGCTYHPSAVMRNYNLVPLFRQEIRNLLAANNNPKLLDRPKVNKYFYQENKPFSFDLEWHRGTDKVYVVGVSYDPKEAYTHYSDNTEWIKEVLNEGKFEVAGHNICTADLVVMGYSPEQIRDLPNIFDTMLAAHLIHPHWASAVKQDEEDDTQEESGNLGLYDLGSLVRFYFPTSGWKEDKKDTLEYNGRDNAYTERLKRKLKVDLAITDQTHLMKKQQKLAAMTVAMHQRGVMLDVEPLQQFCDERREFLDGLRVQLEAIGPTQTTGKKKIKVHAFNPNSNQQIKIFARERGIKLKDTKYETLKRYEGQNKEFDWLIEYKEDSKSLSTWFPIEKDATGRWIVTNNQVHPTYHTTGTSVRRPSSSGPNDLNVPEGGIRILKGGATKELPNLRRFHVARAAGLWIVSFDFSQIENRMLAFLSGDKFSLEVFKSDKKSHRLIAASMFHKLYEDVTEDEYKKGKECVHGLGYGETDHHLAKSILGRTTRDALAEAARLRAAYFSICPGIEQYHKTISAQLERGDLSLRNPFGAVRKIYAQDAHERLKRGVHFMGCSTAADLVNQCAITVWEQLDLVPLKWVYDELAYELPIDDIKTIKMIKEILEQPVPELDGMIVPTKIKAGYSYGLMEEIAA